MLSVPLWTTSTSLPAKRWPVGIVFREVAKAIELEWGGEADAH